MRTAAGVLGTHRRLLSVRLSFVQGICAVIFIMLHVLQIDVPALKLRLI